ncbi:MAG: type II toxin-antitoxin system HicB family antitoxin [Thermoplasmatota archaeon]
MQWDVVLEVNPETGVWIAEAVGVAGCYTQGKSRAEALSNIREVIELVRETEGLPTQPHVELVSIEA